MDTIYKAPEWLYKQANLDNAKLPVYQAELIKLVTTNIPDYKTRPSQFVVPADIDGVRESCPQLMQRLEELGIADMLIMVAMIVVQPGYHYPIHIDSTNPARMSFGLNIPVLNCKESYTVWYDARIEYEKYVPDYLIGSDIAYMSVPCDENTAVEIGRCDANIPHWVNVSIPHVPKCDHNMLRINSSFRFSPKIFELIADGYFEKNLVKQVL